MPWVLIPLFWALAFQFGFAVVTFTPAYLLVPIGAALGWLYGWRGVLAVALGGVFFALDVSVQGFRSGDLGLFSLILFGAWVAHTRRPLNRIIERRPSDTSLTVLLVLAVALLPLYLVLADTDAEGGKIGYWGDLTLALHLLFLVLGLAGYPTRRFVFILCTALAAGLLLAWWGVEKGPQGLLSPLLGVGQRDLPVSGLRAYYGWDQPIEVLTGIAYFWTGRMLAGHQRPRFPTLILLLLILWGAFDILRPLAIEVFAAPDFPAPGFERGDVMLDLTGSRDALLLAVFVAGLTMGYRALALMLLMVAAVAIVASDLQGRLLVPDQSIQIVLAVGYFGALARQAQEHLRTGRAIDTHARVIGLVAIGAVVGIPAALDAPLMVIGMAAIYGWIAFAANRIKQAVNTAGGELTADGWLPFAACIHVAGILWATLSTVRVSDLVEGLRDAGDAMLRLARDILAGGPIPLPRDEEQFAALATLAALVPTLYLFGRVIVRIPKLTDDMVKAGLVAWLLVKGSDAATLRSALQRPGKIAAWVRDALRRRPSVEAIVRVTQQCRTYLKMHRRTLAAALVLLALGLFALWFPEGRDRLSRGAYSDLELDRENAADRALWGAALEAVAQYRLVEQDFAKGRLSIGPIYDPDDRNERWTIQISLRPAASGLPLEERINIYASRETLGWRYAGGDAQFADRIERSIYERARAAATD